MCDYLFNVETNKTAVIRRKYWGGDLTSQEVRDGFFN